MLNPVRFLPGRTTRSRTFGARVAGALTGVVVAGAALVGVPPAATATTAEAAEAAEGAAAAAVKIGPKKFDQPAWAAEWMTGKTKYTEATAVEAAKRYDVIAAMGATFKEFAPAMRRANPDLKILAYVNGPFAARWARPYPESWYAHNTAGNRVKATTFGNDLMNAYLPEWRTEVVRLCRDQLAQSGYDGCFLDSLGNGILDGSYLNSRPVDPRTGAVYTHLQWIKDTGALAQHVRDVTGVPVATNGLGNGNRWATKDVHHLSDGSDLAMAEMWLRAPHASASAFPTAKVWKQNVDMLTQSEARGTGVLTVTKMWSKDNTPALVDQWYEYTLGSFLLGADGRSRMFFLSDGCTPHVCGTGASDLAHQPAPDVAIGDPTGAYTAAGGGVYTRAYDAGFVAVNPEKAAARLTLPAGTWRTLDGDSVSGTVTVPATSGLVLTRAGAAPGATPGTTPAPEPQPEPAPAPAPAPAPGPGSVSARCDGLAATIVGTRGADVITGTPGPDVIQALGGNDRIDGRGGDDVICGGGGNDRITGGAGNDVVFAGGGADAVGGRAGNDQLHGGRGPDTVSGGAGRDGCTGGAGRDRLRRCEAPSRR